MRNVLDKNCRENQNIYFMFNSAVYNVKKYGEAKGATNDVTMWRIRVACWISFATCTHARACTDRQMCNTYCFSTATMFRERATMLRYTYIGCLVDIRKGTLLWKLQKLCVLKLYRLQYFCFYMLSNVGGQRKKKLEEWRRRKCVTWERSHVTG